MRQGVPPNSAGEKCGYCSRFDRTRRIGEDGGGTKLAASLPSPIRAIARRESSPIVGMQPDNDAARKRGNPRRAGAVFRARSD